MKTLILASASERRKRILAECGIRFKAVPADVKEESPRDGDIIRAVVHNARLKAEHVSKNIGREVVLGADTLVLFDGELIGKPADMSGAEKLLRRFSGREIKVCTGLFVADNNSGRKASGWEETDVRARRIEAGETPLYMRYLGPFDKAGGFSIEGAGALVFDDIRGSYYNVLGLPMAKLSDILKEAGLSIFSFME